MAATASRLGIAAIVPGQAGEPEVDLLDAEAVVAAAHAAQADALHPGYGFLSENAAFAEAVERGGIAWVGPPGAAIRAMGDKAAARRLARSLGVPVVPGYDEPEQSDEALAGAARRIGYPLLAKPAGGGGGKGMRVVRGEEDLGEAIAASRREARAAFGDDRLILERHLDGPRHIEVQVLFDGSGAGVHLGERDCSLQRRHQKVLEESPSPAADASLRARLGGAALKLAGAVGYQSAGTCEFLVDDAGEAYFLEMNTRLQVEHPVTELVVGRDLVADQLGIAEGLMLADLGLEQAAVDRAFATGGHAVEVRLYAEDAEDGFLPATGRIELVRWPHDATSFEPVNARGIRIDPGIDVGDLVGARFDPMLAKIIAHGASRGEAFDRLSAALGQTIVLGVVTNLRFLRWLVRLPTVRDGEARVDTLERMWQPEAVALPDADLGDAWLLAGRALVESLARRTDDPWTGGWRVNAAACARLASGEEERSVLVDVDRANPGVDARAERDLVVHDGVAHIDVDGRSVPFRLADPPDVDRAARDAARHRAGTAADGIAAPMPGNVLAVHATVGSAVAAGDAIVTLEAMKMEHVVGAPVAGRVREVAVQEGEQVAKGQLLAVVEP